MTNYDHLITLPVEKFNTEIITVVNSFGGNPDLLYKFLTSNYVEVKTLHELLNENYNLNKITFRYGGSVYECTSVKDFTERYGTVASGILDMRVVSVRTGRNGNKTVVL